MTPETRTDRARTSTEKDARPADETPQDEDRSEKATDAARQFRDWALI